MLDANQIGEIISLYKKHGWQLRRVLLTEKLKSSLGSSAETLFPDVEIVSAEIDAAWFSRNAPRDKGDAWEIRHLSRTPFALIEVFDAEDEEEVREETLHEMQEELRERTKGNR